MREFVAATMAGIGAVIVVAGCASGQPGATSTSPPPSTSAQQQVTGDLVVFAAASLKATFTSLGNEFQKNHPGTHVSFDFAGSSDLVTQLTQGAPADVFASADVKNMTKAADAGLLTGSPTNFASNTLTIVTPPGNPKHVTSFADLAKPGTQVVVCASQVPCGSATVSVEKATGVTLAPVSEESAVTDVLGKITTGQADAGLVYVTDAAGAGTKVTTVAFPESKNAVNTYPIALLKESKNPATARAFIGLVTSPAGRKVLTDAGFAAP